MYGRIWDGLRILDVLALVVLRHYVADWAEWKHIGEWEAAGMRSQRRSRNENSTTGSSALPSARSVSEYLISLKYHAKSSKKKTACSRQYKPARIRSSTWTIPMTITTTGMQPLTQSKVVCPAHSSQLLSKMAETAPPPPEVINRPVHRHFIPPALSPLCPAREYAEWREWFLTASSHQSSSVSNRVESTWIRLEPYQSAVSWVRLSSFHLIFCQSERRESVAKWECPTHSQVPDRQSIVKVGKSSALGHWVMGQNESYAHFTCYLLRARENERACDSEGVINDRTHQVFPTAGCGRERSEVRRAWNDVANCSSFGIGIDGDCPLE